MKIYSGFSDKRLERKPRCVTIGIFDGVHLGHQKILKTAVRLAKRDRCRSMVITFDPDPMRVLAPNKSHPILMSLPHRLKIFEKLGLSEALVVPFNKTFSHISRETFLNKNLIKRVGMRSLVVGHDFSFGHKSAGSLSFLLSESKIKLFKVMLIPALKIGGQIISSTRIRGLISHGNLSLAEGMLGRPVSVYGTVIHGKGRGRALGFPTANLDPHHEVFPPNGVYAVRGFLGNCKLRGVVHIGSKPTFQDKDRSIEVHFFDFHNDIYNKDLELFFLKRLRSIRRFANASQLKKAIIRDSQKARQILA